MANVELTYPLTEEHDVPVAIAPHPPKDPQKTQVFRQFFTDDGLETGSSDMGVDGSSTNVDFWIPAHVDNDRYITRINIIVGYGTTGQPNEWADGTALSNGTQMLYDSGSGQHTIHGGIQSNQDMFRLHDGDIGTAWEVRHVNSSNDFGYFVNMQISLFMPPYGIQLAAGSNQKILIRIRDNVGTDADSFNAIAYGFDRLA